MDFYKDLYIECLMTKRYLELNIESKEEEIKKIKKELEENKKFFEKTFNISIDKCLNKSYNEYIKEQEKEKR